MAQETDNKQLSDDEKRDRILTRMLKTPPSPKGIRENAPQSESGDDDAGQK